MGEYTVTTRYKGSCYSDTSRNPGRKDMQAKNNPFSPQVRLDIPPRYNDIPSQNMTLQNLVTAKDMVSATVQWSLCGQASSSHDAPPPGTCAYYLKSLHIAFFADSDSGPCACTAGMVRAAALSGWLSTRIQKGLCVAC